MRKRFGGTKKTSQISYCDGSSTLCDARARAEKARDDYRALVQSRGPRVY